MADMKAFIKSHLLEPLKQYPTVVQDTMIELISDRLSELYEYTVKFPEIVEPNKYRLDILKAIADQFLFTVREEADLQEQVDILSNIVQVYSKRGSIDTIENMWKYYGGDLPKDVKVVIPSYNLFRYSVSTLSGRNLFPDSVTNRTGVYEIKLINNTYPIPELRDFLIDELVAAGNYIYFTNVIHSDLISGEEDTNQYVYNVQKNTLKELTLSVLKSHQGFTWSGYNALSSTAEDSLLSGKPDIFLEITRTFQLDLIDMATEAYADISIITEKPLVILYRINSELHRTIQINKFLYCTPSDPDLHISRYLYNSNGDIVSQYQGYYILGETLLGEEVI